MHSYSIAVPLPESHVEKGRKFLLLFCDCHLAKVEGLIYAQFKRRTFHVLNLMQMSENNRFSSLALESADEKFDVSNGPNLGFE